MQGNIKPSLEYIEQNLKTDIKTEELANMTGYSVTHFYRLFNKATGLPVAHYISKKRITYALFEILAGRKAIDAVMEYGFDTYAGFYKAFVKMYGCSPMKYLTLNKELTPQKMEELLMEYNLTKQQKEKITERWGSRFHLKILQNFDLYSAKWKLTDFEFGEFYTHHVVFFCKSEIHGGCVLKIYDNDELEREYNALREYNAEASDYYVKTLGYERGDKSNGAMLIERISPGKKLSDEPSLEKHLEVFSSLWHQLHIVPKDPDIYYSYTHWVNTIGMPDELKFKDRDVELADFDNLKAQHPEFYPHALRAKEIYLNLISVYDKKLLIHGNIHSGNIMSYENGKYKTIAPTGVIGDPIFDAGSFIFGECCWYGKSIAMPKKAEIIINYLEKSLNIPGKTLRQCFYITTVMRYHDIDRIKFAEAVLHG